MLPKVVIILGPTYSGKSTNAFLLEKNMNFKIVTKKGLLKDCINKPETKLRQRLIIEADEGQSFTDDKLIELIDE